MEVLFYSIGAVVELTLVYLALPDHSSINNNEGNF